MCDLIAGQRSAHPFLPNRIATETNVFQLFLQVLIVSLSYTIGRYAFCSRYSYNLQNPDKMTVDRGRIRSRPISGTQRKGSGHAAEFEAPMFYRSVRSCNLHSLQRPRRHSEAVAESGSTPPQQKLVFLVKNVFFFQAQKKKLSPPNMAAPPGTESAKTSRVPAVL